jgi:hypothetical protein
MASYNEDPIDRELSYWSDDDAWTQYKERFVKMKKAERVDALTKTGLYLQVDLKPTEANLKPNHETASLWTKRSELQQLDRTLDRLGK